MLNIVSHTPPVFLSNLKKELNKYLSDFRSNDSENTQTKQTLDLQIEKLRFTDVYWRVRIEDVFMQVVCLCVSYENRISFNVSTNLYVRPQNVLSVSVCLSLSLSVS